MKKASFLCKAKGNKLTTRGVCQPLKYKIKHLEDKLEEHGKIKYVNPSYWIDDGDSQDGPFCQKCYDADTKLTAAR